MFLILFVILFVFVLSKQSRFLWCHVTHLLGIVGYV